MSRTSCNSSSVDEQSDGWSPGRNEVAAANERCDGPSLTKTVDDTACTTFASAGLDDAGEPGYSGRRYSPTCGPGNMSQWKG
jgi:hypothetical protein